MRALPPKIKQQVQQRLWASASEMQWLSMTVIERTKQYGRWVLDPEIGGVLAGYMDPRRVRIYIKDTLMKPYSRARVADPANVMSMLSLGENEKALEKFERPHGVRLHGDRIVCWGKADDWKLVLMAVHERAYAIKAIPFAAVLTPPLTRFVTPVAREVVEEAAQRLQISKLRWYDPEDRLEGAPLMILGGISATA